MDLKELSTPLPKPWLNIKANSITADSIVGPVVATSITFPDSVAPANPSAGSITLYSNVSGKLSTQDSAGNSVPYVPITGAQMVGNIDMNANSLLHVLTLSGATNTRTGDNIVSNAGTSFALSLPEFADTSGKIIQDSGVLLADVVQNTGGAVIATDLASFSGTSGTSIVDSGIRVANVVQNQGSTVTANNIPLFPDSSGRLLVDSLISQASISGGPFVKNKYSLIDNGSTPNFINNTTVQTSLVLTPPATQLGSLIFPINSTGRGTIIKMRGTTQFNLLIGDTFQLFIGNLTGPEYYGLPIYTAVATVSNIRCNIDVQIWIDGNGNAIIQANQYYTDAASTIVTSNGNNTSFWARNVSNTLDLSGQFSVASTSNQAFQTVLDVTQQF